MTDLLLPIPVENPCMDGVNLLVLHGIIALFPKWGIEYIIAGGYPRDLYFRKRPKDVDIFVTHIIKLRHLLDRMGISYTMYDSYTPRTDTNLTTNRIDGVIKIGDIDIIGISEDADSPLDQVLHYFDYNFNQFVIDDGVPKFVGKNFGTLCRSSDEGITESRILHITKKAIRENWNVETT